MLGGVGNGHQAPTVAMCNDQLRMARSRSFQRIHYNQTKLLAVGAAISGQSRYGTTHHASEAVYDQNELLAICAAASGQSRY